MRPANIRSPYFLLLTALAFSCADS